MDNQEFLETIGNSFKKFLSTGSRSNEKLKILHGNISQDLEKRLGDGYSVKSLRTDGDSGEIKLNGRYIEKAVDIAILKGNNPIAGIGVKFVMQNYSQTSNNYFENMLGETANIRCANIPYFQIFIIPDVLPYYKNDGSIQKWETFTMHNSEKYITLSKDKFEVSIHTPVKTLLYVVQLPPTGDDIRTKKDYVDFYSKLNNFTIKESYVQYDAFSSAVIYNNYEEFAQKVVHYIKFL